MGNCCQVDEATRAIDKKNKEDEEIEKHTSKILFLGIYTFRAFSFL